MPRIIGPAQRQSPKGFISGLYVTATAPTTVTFSTGYARSDDDTYDINVTSTLTVDITLTGAGGRRSTIVEAANAWYSLWLIADSRGVNAPAAFLDTVSTAPTLPSGYNKQRRIGWIRNNGSSNFRDVNLVKAAGQYREVHYRVTENNLQVLAGATSTSYATIDLTGLIPPTCSCAYLLGRIDAPGDTDFVRWRPTADAAALTTGVPLRTFGGDTQTGNGVSSDTFYFHVAGGSMGYQVVPAGAWTTSVDLWVLGYIDMLD